MSIAIFAQGPPVTITQAHKDVFLRKLVKDDPDRCWPMGDVPGVTAAIYARNPDGNKPRYIRAKASRVSYETFVGLIPYGHLVRHKCDNPPCVNPAHLMTGTHKENVRDCVMHGRRARGDRHHQSKLTVEFALQVIVDYERGDITYAQLGEKYGLAKGYVGRIVRRDTWHTREHTVMAPPADAGTE